MPNMANQTSCDFVLWRGLSAAQARFDQIAIHLADFVGASMEISVKLLGKL
jgi:hypothetical protein